MKNQKEQSDTQAIHEDAYAEFDSFEELLDQALKRLDYWVEGAKNEFTEITVRRMQALGISRSELAQRLGKKQSHVTKLLGGNNNFTIETMVQIAEALGCHFRCHLEPTSCQTHWVDVARTLIPGVETAAEPSAETSIDDETFASAA